MRFNESHLTWYNAKSAVWVFDVWVSFMRKLGLYIILQYHDEVLVQCEKGEENTINERIQQAMKQTNEFLKLNVTIACDSKSGVNYAECH